MALPRKLKHMNLFNDGQSYMGVASSVTLPKLERKIEKVRLAGMDGPAGVDLGMGDDGIVLEWKLGGFDWEALKQYGATSANAIALRFMGSVQRDDTGEISAVEITVRGRHESIEMGEAKPGEDTEMSINTACTYYKLVVDGQELIEIDTLAMIFKVNGKDMYEQHRKNIGL